MTIYGIISISEYLKRKMYTMANLFLHFQQPQIILLKEGTEASQGRSQIISNINACQVMKAHEIAQFNRIYLK